MKKTNKIVISSGKGGVGKSMLASTLAMLFAKTKKVVAVDCDVDAPNLAIWLNETGKWKKIEKISVSEKPVIDNSKCNGNCAQCVEKCKFGALSISNQQLTINNFLCEGCGACEIFCPPRVIKMRPVKNGEIRIKKTKYDFPLIVGQLFPGETGSGKIVTEIKERASAVAEALADKEKFDCTLMIIDSAPGTGCPVIAALQDADFVVLVTEPFPSAFSDLKRVLQVVSHFKIPWGLVINKWDINPGLSNEIERWSKEKLIGKISYDKEIFKAISNLTPILETNLKVRKEIKQIFSVLKSHSCR